MIISISSASDVPIYEQLIRSIVRAVANREIERGDRLPSVRDMAAELGINLHTVNKAYQELVAMGYVCMDRRLGAKINDRFEFSEERNEKIKDELSYYVADLSNMGFSDDEILNLVRERISAKNEGTM